MKTNNQRDLTTINRVLLLVNFSMKIAQKKDLVEQNTLKLKECSDQKACKSKWLEIEL